MEKRWKIAGVMFCVSLLLMLSISLVSAGFWGELFSLTGDCVDSDGGKAFLTKGTVQTNNENATDYCIDSANLMEYYCRPDGTIGEEARNGHCVDGAKTYTSSNGVLIEENIGYMVFSDIGYDDDCNIIPGLVACDLWLGMYDFPLEGFEEINVAIMTHHENFTNQMFIDGVATHFNPDIYYIDEENFLGTNYYLIRVDQTSTTESYVLFWYHERSVVFIALINWDPSKLDDEVVEGLFGAYANKYPSQLTFGGFPEPGCTDMDEGLNYYTKATCSDSTGNSMSDGCIVGGDHDGWLREIVCSNGQCQMKDYQCPFGCADGVCIEGNGTFCTDTDDGLNFDVAGNCVHNIRGPTQSHGDVCGVTIDGVPYPNILLEWYCHEEWGCQRYQSAPYTEGYDCEQEGKICQGGQCITPKCTDEDNGKDYYTKGEVKGFLDGEITTRTDHCGGINSELLEEFYCDGGSIKSVHAYECPAGCVDGACIEPETCVDLDGGENIYEASEARGKNIGSVDNCVFSSNPKGVLREAVCDGTSPTHVDITCPAEAPYCNRAVCSTEEPVCTDTDGGNVPYVRGTITEPRYEDGPQHTDYCERLDNKQPWYNYDCEGTDCPPCKGENCGLREFYCTDPFVITAYQDIKCPAGCVDGACSFVNDLQEGECYDSENGKSFFKKGITYDHGELYPSEDSCDGNILIEYYCGFDKTRKIFYRKEKLHECKWGCEDGACLGTGKKVEVKKKKKDMPKDDEIKKIVYICSGCLWKDKCYPIGFREEGKYCSSNEEFNDYLPAGAACDNSFECKSNVCVSGECISGSFLRKIMNWFKRIFGSE
jgi:hypothetical protein